jgi:cell division protein FtsQ
MKFWKKRSTSGTRRNTKVWVLRLRKSGFALAVMLTIASTTYYAWANGAVASFGAFVHDKTIAATAASGFRVSEIMVTGRNNIAQDDILQRLDIEEDAPLFGVSLAAAQQSLSEIPWVEKAVVSRRLPDKIIVSITERAPVALWQYQKKISVIDATGLSLTSSNIEAYKNLPLIVGEDAPEHVTEMIGLLRAEPGIAKEVTSAIRVGGRRWDLKLKNGVTVKLPEYNVELALSRLAAAQQDHSILNGRVASVDLRIPERFVIVPATLTPVAESEKKKESI